MSYTSDELDICNDPVGRADTTSAYPGATESPSRTDVEIRLMAADIPAAELGRIADATGTHVAVMVPDKTAKKARAAVLEAGFVSCRAFTPTGSGGGAFRIAHPDYSGITLAALPLDLAENLLEQSQSDGGLTPVDRFRIAAYIRAYYGSFEQFVALAPDTGAPDLDIEQLARAANITPAPTRSRASLDAYLASIGWRPAVDMLERLGLADRWIREKLQPRLVTHREMPPGLSAFFFRERAIRNGFRDTMRAALEETGFEILDTAMLDGEVIDQIRRTTRGGNWGSGPLPLSGGPPVELIFAVDVFPARPSPATLARHPFLDNSRTLTAKLAARDAVFRHLPPKKRFNPLHSSDNSGEAMRLMETVLPVDRCATHAASFAARLAETEAACEGAEAMEGANEVTAHIRIHSEGAERIRKVFRPQYAAHLRQAADVQTALSADWPEIPPVLACGDRYLEFADPGGAFVPLSALPDPAPVATVERLRKLLRAVAKLGVVPDGWDPGQGVLTLPATGAVLIPGFDRLKLATTTRPLESALPPAGTGRYQSAWYPVLGIPRGLFLRGGSGAMHLFRSIVFPFHRNVSRLNGKARVLARSMLKR